MAADYLSEQRMTLTELARREGVNLCTTWRWATRGVRGCKLETFTIGVRRYTTYEAFARWVAATSEAGQLGPSPTIQARTSRQRESAIKRAERELSKAGI